MVNTHNNKNIGVNINNRTKRRLNIFISIPLFGYLFGKPARLGRIVRFSRVSNSFRNISASKGRMVWVCARNRYLSSPASSYAGKARQSPAAPSVAWGQSSRTGGGCQAIRYCVKPPGSPRHCERSEAIWFQLKPDGWVDCFASLAMTADRGAKTRTVRMVG